MTTRIEPNDGGASIAESKAKARLECMTPAYRAMLRERHKVQVDAYLRHHTITLHVDDGAEVLLNKRKGKP